MILYTFNELKQLVDCAKCRKDLQEIEDYLQANIKKYSVDNIYNLKSYISIHTAYWRA